MILGGEVCHKVRSRQCKLPGHRPALSGSVVDIYRRLCVRDMPGRRVAVVLNRVAIYRLGLRARYAGRWWSEITRYF